MENVFGIFIPFIRADTRVKLVNYHTTVYNNSKVDSNEKQSVVKLKQGSYLIKIRVENNFNNSFVKSLKLLSSVECCIYRLRSLRLFLYLKFSRSFSAILFIGKYPRVRIKKVFYKVIHIVNVDIHTYGFVKTKKQQIGVSIVKCTQPTVIVGIFSSNDKKEIARQTKNVTEFGDLYLYVCIRIGILYQPQRYFYSRVICQRNAAHNEQRFSLPKF